MNRSMSIKVILTFVILIAVGTSLLLLPFSIVKDPTKGHSRFIEALFTATSATCVTGLIVLDTAQDFSYFGKTVILILIQLGGLGIMTLSNIILNSLGRRMGLSGRMSVQQTLGQVSTVDPKKMLRHIIRFTFIFEAIGALLLFLRFIFDYPFVEAINKAVFHSVSAFCNAGFSTFSDSLVRYNGDIFVNLVVAILIIAGGLGFIVFSDIWSIRHRPKKHRWSSLSFHSRIVMIMTISLLFLGTIMYFIAESANYRTIGGRGISGILSAFFMSVTSRTAGFNTLDVSQLTNFSLILTIGLMFIGASPGSTGGGIKTTTFAIIYALIRSRIKNRPQAEMQGRSIPRALVAKSLATGGAFVGFIIGALILIEFAELGGIPHSESRGQFLNHLFEVVSALGTVGLSTGITSDLKDFSRIIITICMLAGRVGPLLLANSLIGQKAPLPYTLPEEELNVG